MRLNSVQINYATRCVLNLLRLVGQALHSHGLFNVHGSMWHAQLLLVVLRLSFIRVVLSLLAFMACLTYTLFIIVAPVFLAELLHSRSISRHSLTIDCCFMLNRLISWHSGHAHAVWGRRSWRRRVLILFVNWTILLREILSVRFDQFAAKQRFLLLSYMLLLLLGSYAQLTHLRFQGLSLSLQVALEVDKIAALDERATIDFMHRVRRWKKLAALNLLLPHLLHL